MTTDTGAFRLPSSDDDPGSPVVVDLTGGADADARSAPSAGTPLPSQSRPDRAARPLAEPPALATALSPTPEPAPALDPAPFGESVAGTSGGRPRWLPRYVAALVALDALALLLGGLVGQFARFMSFDDDVNGISYARALGVLVPGWVLLLAAARTYEGRFLGLGSEEFRRVGNAAARFTAVLAILLVLMKLDVARGLVVVAIPSAAAFTLLFRYLARQQLHRARAAGSASHRVLLVGEGGPREILASRLAANPHCGLHVVGATSPVAAAGRDGIDHVPALAAQLGADTVAVVQTPLMTPDLLRRLAWSLEGTGTDLLVAPGLTDVAGPRINIRPVSGLPLLQIAAPEYTGVRRLAKNAMDLACTGLLVLLLSPLFVAVALAVRVSSSGPVLFRQKRIGLHGRPFTMLKFRSMYLDAEERLEELRALNDHGRTGVLFKMTDDPRVTAVGRVLRRLSLDELPQLFNVLTGTMSLVGPRPPLPDEVARYETDVRRRLLVKPGITGLWQVSGRADLSWDETVRLDLYYVENWSVMFDLEILWKTARAVLRGSGAR